MENKVVTINCAGNMEEIIEALKEVISKLEDAYQTDGYSNLNEGSFIETYSRVALLKVVK
jgi:hypothetical protein